MTIRPVQLPRSLDEPILTWQEELFRLIALNEKIVHELPLSQEERVAIASAQDGYPLLIPPHYLRLINWTDPADPLRRLLIPSTEEALDAGALDTSGEADSLVTPGLQHKYAQTAALLLTQACAGHCRYCFRRRLLSRDELSRESIGDLTPALQYLRDHEEINNVLLTGGDPLIASNARLANLFEALSLLGHIRQIRISTKIPAFFPARILRDTEFVRLLISFGRRFQFLIACHFDHSRELTEECRESLRVLRESGCMLTSQIALTRGINDSERVLTELVHDLHYAGVVPHYIFHPRPVKHATHFQIPIVRGLELVDKVKAQCAGPVKRFRYVLAHPDGKAELVGIASCEGRSLLVIRWHQLRRGLMREVVELRPFHSNATWI